MEFLIVMPKQTGTMKALHAPSRRKKDSGSSSSMSSSIQNTTGTETNLTSKPNRKKNNSVEGGNKKSMTASDFLGNTDAWIGPIDDSIIVDTDEVWEKDDDQESRASYNTSEENLEATDWKGSVINIIIVYIDVQSF